MNNQMSRAELVAYARAENIANHFGAPSEALDTLGDLLAYIGNEMYRPVTRLMLQNWNELEKQRLQEHIEKVRAEEAAMAQAEAERLMREEGK